MKAAIALIALFAVLGARGVAQNTAEPGVPHETIFKTKEAIALRLTVEKAVVHSGEPVAVRIEVINRTTRPMALFPAEPWYLTTLTISKNGESIRRRMALGWTFTSLVSFHGPV